MKIVVDQKGSRFKRQPKAHIIPVADLQQHLGEQGVIQRSMTYAAPDLSM